MSSTDRPHLRVRPPCSTPLFTASSTDVEERSQIFSERAGSERGKPRTRRPGAPPLGRRTYQRDRSPQIVVVGNFKTPGHRVFSCCELHRWNMKCHQCDFEGMEGNDGSGADPRDSCGVARVGVVGSGPYREGLTSTGVPALDSCRGTRNRDLASSRAAGRPHGLEES